MRPMINRALSLALGLLLLTTSAAGDRKSVV